MTKKIYLIFLIIFNTCLAHGQEILEVSKEVLKINKIYKCVEHISNDSLTTQRDTSGGHYVIFDTQGRKIEQNIENGMGQTQVFYMYDKLGRQSMFVWHDKNSTPKISRIYIYKYNEKGDKIGYCDYSPNYDPKCDSISQYFYHFDTIDKRPNKNTLITIECRDKNMKDTVSKFYQYYNNNRLDSTKIYDLNNKPTEIEFIVYFYNSSDIKVSEKLLRYDNKRILRRKDSYYLPNGLLNYVETRNNFYSSKKRTWVVDYSKATFEYFYWK
jgi:hypothetical protein